MVTDEALNRAAAEACGKDIPPSREYAMAKVMWTYLSMTGDTMRLNDGREFVVPPGKDLPQPEGSTDWNARKGLDICELTGYDADNYPTETKTRPAKTGRAF